MDYKKVIKDFNNGVIDPKKYQVIMDNDSGYWLCIDESIEDEDKRDSLASKMTEKYGDPDGCNDIVDALNAAGVNCDGVNRTIPGLIMSDIDYSEYNECSECTCEWCGGDNFYCNCEEAINCICGAYVFNKKQEAVHVADCICGRT